MRVKDRLFTLLCAIAVSSLKVPLAVSSLKPPVPRRRAQSHARRPPPSARNIVILSHGSSQDVAVGLFDDRNLLHGRVDVLARCITSSLFISNRLRSDTSVFILLSPHNVTVEISGSRCAGLNPDERTAALMLQRTLLSGGDAQARLPDYAPVRSPPREAGQGALPKSERNRLRTERKAREAMRRRIGRACQDPPPGWTYHADDDLPRRLESFEGDLLVFHEDGKDLWDSDALVSVGADLPRPKAAPATLVFGDQNGFSSEDEAVLESLPRAEFVSVGPLSLLTSQAITVSHHYLDRMAAL